MDRDWTPNPPATDIIIEKLVKAVDVELPNEYLGILRKYNGGEGDLALPPMWLQLWSVDEVIENYENDFYKTEFPGCFFFASNGGMESIAIRKTDSNKLDIVMIDPIAGIKSAESIAHDFQTFESAIGLPYEEEY